MNRLEKKMTATLLIAIFMISMMAFAVNANPGVILVSAPDGSAVWSTAEKYTGSCSVELDTGDFGAGAIKIAIEPVLLSALTADPSYWVFEPTVVSGGQYPVDGQHHPWGHPYMNLVLDLDGDGDLSDKDYLEGIGSTAGPVVDDKAVDPTSSTWTEMYVGWGYYDGDDSIIGGDFSGHDPVTWEFRVHTLAAWITAMSTAHPDAKVVEVQIQYGYWGGLNTQCSPVYVDDIVFNGVTYPLEEPDSDSVSLLGEALSPESSFTVTPTGVGFGSGMPGQTLTATGPITITNTGNYRIDVIAELTDPDGFYEDLTINNVEVGSWDANIHPYLSDTRILTLKLTVPLDAASGEHTATLIFWAEATEYVIPP